MRKFATCWPKSNAKGEPTVNLAWRAHRLARSENVIAAVSARRQSDRVEELTRGLEPAVLEHHDPVEAARKFEIVRGDQGGQAGAAGQFD